VFVLLLNIQSSPRGAKSASIAVTKAFLDAYQALHSDATIDTMNVWEENLRDFDQEAIGAQYKGVNKEPMDQAETAVWGKIQELALRFQQAGRVACRGMRLRDNRALLESRKCAAARLRYLGDEQDLVLAPNDRIKLRVAV
jgi:hypothetical protein